jgi:hypothetical protein
VHVFLASLSCSMAPTASERIGIMSVCENIVLLGELVRSSNSSAEVYRVGGLYG